MVYSYELGVYLVLHRVVIVGDAQVFTNLVNEDFELAESEKVSMLLLSNIHVPRTS